VDAVTLNQFAAQKRLAILSALQAGSPPPEGSYSEEVLRLGKSKGKGVQMGTTRFEPHAIHFEFIYPDPQGSPVVLTVSVSPPERIVFLPVPKWVVESIWQGEIAGSPHFESDARSMLDEFLASLEPGVNDAAFLPRPPIARDG
jgi:hypothetical protein